MNIDISQMIFIDKNLRVMCEQLEKDTGLIFAITSLYRIGDNGVHGTLPLRGLDLRMRNYLIGKECENLINNKWIYDPARQHLNCALLHGENYNLHLHLQVHPSTTYYIL